MQLLDFEAWQVKGPDLGVFPYMRFDITGQRPENQR